jgi:hypothetical protein
LAVIAPNGPYELQNAPPKCSLSKAPLVPQVPETVPALGPIGAALDHT